MMLRFLLDTSALLAHWRQEPGSPQSSYGLHPRKRGAADRPRDWIESL